MQPLLPERREQLDFFVCDIFDATPKDDLGSMEHPMFTLATNPDTAIRHYEHHGNSITITPSVLGLATIFDKDVLIYCISQLVGAINQGRPISRTVRVTAYDLLKATNRQTGGESYDRLEQALERLKGTQIKTDITTGCVRIRDIFGLIERVRIIERSPLDERMIAIEITLSEWLYNAVQALEVLTIHRDYFRIRKPLDRRLYELTRKHCGQQGKWPVSIALLYKKSGSRGDLREFRRAIKHLAEHQHLPEYRIMYYEADDKVTFYSREAHGHNAQLQDLIAATRAKKPVKWSS
jgi:plasmid replication initiation protein